MHHTLASKGFSCVGDATSTRRIPTGVQSPLAAAMNRPTEPLTSGRQAPRPSWLRLRGCVYLAAS